MKSATTRREWRVPVGRRIDGLGPRIDGLGERIEEYRCSEFERDAMLVSIDGGLASVPSESVLVHRG